MTELWPKIKEETPMVLKVSQRRGWSLWEHFPLNIFVLIYLINFPQPFFFSLTVFFFGAESYPNGSFSHELNSIDKTQRLRRIHVKMVIWHFSVAYFLLSGLNTKNLIFSCREWNISTFLQDQENIKSWYSLV